jgi:hypothetical protein
VWVSITTTPARLHLLQPVLASLVASAAAAGVPASRVVVQVPATPPYPPVTSGDDDDGCGSFSFLPPWLLPHAKRCAADLGPITKLTAALDLGASNGGLVIVADDDLVYPLGMVPALLAAVRASETHAEAAATAAAAAAAATGEAFKATPSSEANNRIAPILRVMSANYCALEGSQGQGRGDPCREHEVAYGAAGLRAGDLAAERVAGAKSFVLEGWGGVVYQRRWFMTHTNCPKPA